MRSLVGIAATAGLVVATAAPASAELPSDTAIDARISGGNIHIGGNDFPLGDDVPPGNPTDCNPDELESTVTAFVDADGAVSDLDFDFQPGTQDVAIVGITCLTIVITNEASLTGQLDLETGALTISAVMADVEIENPNFNPGCGLRDIDAGGLAGSVEDVPRPIPGSVESGVFDVPVSSDCGELGGAIDSFLGLPADDGMAVLELEVDW